MRFPRRFSLLAALAAGVWYFRSVHRFRDPVRLPPRDLSGAVLSPADGLVSFVRPIENGQAEGLPVAELLGIPQGSGWLMGIFVRPLDVHYTYAPVGGTVLNAGHKEGARQGVGIPKIVRFLLGQTVDLLGSELVRGNERYSYAVQDESGQLMAVSLIAAGAGLQATVYLDEGQTVRQGNKAAFLAEGGLVLIAFPPTLTPQVIAGQRLKGAETVLAQPVKLEG